MEKENHGTFGVGVPWFLFRNIQHREGRTPGEGSPSADADQGLCPLDPTSFSSEKIKEAKRS